MKENEHTSNNNNDEKFTHGERIRAPERRRTEHTNQETTHPLELQSSSSERTECRMAQIVWNNASHTPHHFIKVDRLNDSPKVFFSIQPSNGSSNSADRSIEVSEHLSLYKNQLKSVLDACVFVFDGVHLLHFAHIHKYIAHRIIPLFFIAALFIFALQKPWRYTTLTGKLDSQFVFFFCCSRFVFVLISSRELIKLLPSFDASLRCPA